MKNVMMIDGQRAVIEYDPDIEMFRDEFVGLNGSADFYAKNIAGLKQEGKASLKVFLQICAEEGIDPSSRIRENSCYVLTLARTTRRWSRPKHPACR